MAHITKLRRLCYASASNSLDCALAQLNTIPSENVLEVVTFHSDDVDIGSAAWKPLDDLLATEKFPSLSSVELTVIPISGSTVDQGTWLTRLLNLHARGILSVNGKWFQSIGRLPNSHTPESAHSVVLRLTIRKDSNRGRITLVFARQIRVTLFVISKEKEIWELVHSNTLSPAEAFRSRLGT